MTTENDELRLDEYYQHIEDAGKLLTSQHARRWSSAALKTLGISLDRGTKRELAKALPEELANDLTGVFWLAHFRDPDQPLQDFLQRVARRAGNTDHQFARLPTSAVFGGINAMIDRQIRERVARSLAPEVSEFWQQAAEEKVLG
ncbi:MAG: DUF2267 domain-containing protein [Candidatus Promineifilaceae bacterium]|nr:DUF2267 domain-containing protein [Candidatus Promineifilaceae bacterium]